VDHFWDRIVLTIEEGKDETTSTKKKYKFWYQVEKEIIEYKVGWNIGRYMAHEMFTPQ
jgi:hypothetical protein